MSKMPVYTHAEQIRIASSHGNNVNYLICFGYVDWKKNGALRAAIYILMEYGGIISYDTPPHITTDKNPDGTTDFEKVMQAIEQLRTKYNL